MFSHKLSCDSNYPEILASDGNGTEGGRDRRAPPQVQLGLSLEQLYNSILGKHWDQHFSLEYHCPAAQ